MTDEQKNKIKNLREKFFSYADIADKLGLSTNAVKSFCFRSGLNTDALIENAKPCKNCGKPIASIAKTKPRIFCCNQCKIAWWKKHKTEEHSHMIKEQICPVCGTAFSDYVSANRKYCSLSCYQRRNQNG